MVIGSMDFGPVLRQNITTEMNITHECSSQDIWETKRRNWDPTIFKSSRAQSQ
jgi:hypothetical protein